jgi:hypothetical protein
MLKGRFIVFIAALKQLIPDRANKSTISFSLLRVRFNSVRGVDRDREMRVVTRFGLVCLAVAASVASAFAVNPPADSSNGLTLHSTVGTVAGGASGSGETATNVSPGETLNIIGDCVMPMPSADNLRVVLTSTDSAASIEPGFRSVLATDQEMNGDTLKVRVPDLPETANRTFEVKVFRLGAERPEICNAGAIRIGGQAKGKVG